MFGAIVKFDSCEGSFSHMQMLRRRKLCRGRGRGEREGVWLHSDNLGRRCCCLCCCCAVWRMESGKGKWRRMRTFKKVVANAKSKGLSDSLTVSMSASVRVCVRVKWKCRQLSRFTVINQSDVIKMKSVIKLDAWETVWVGVVCGLRVECEMWNACAQYLCQ